ncbi:MAG: hypothetical protein JWQ49_4066 [Edaphobacter sp.]|nr:hypothetical protein [Edaphobacter sp.]
MDVNDIKEISKTRFDILAGYTRLPGAFLFGKELAYFSIASDRVLGVFIRDTTDGDYAGIIIGPDEYSQYRAVDVKTFTDSIDIAKAELKQSLVEWSYRPDSDFYQGGPKVERLDIFILCSGIAIKSFVPCSCYARIICECKKCRRADDALFRRYRRQLRKGFPI